MLNIVSANDGAATFADFWLLWPKRVAKMEAERAWGRLSGSQRVEALTGLCSWRPVWMARGDLQYVPHPGTWLNQHRWEDELPQQWAKGGHPSHMVADLPNDGEHTVMPEQVRRKLAEMRRK